ncbi:hypothetical protein GCM10022248_09350 [Nonomuraea soli]
MRLRQKVAIAAVLSITAGCATTLKTHAVTMDDLLLPVEQLPTKSANGAWKASPEDLNPETDSLDLDGKPQGKSALFFGDEEARLRKWDGLVQRVHRLASPSSAEAEQRDAPYGRILVDEENPYGPIVPMSLSTVSLHGDSPALMCAGEGENLERQCPFWQFRERFGAYLVDIDYSRNYDPQRRLIPKDEFLAVVRAIDHHVSEVLKDRAVRSATSASTIRMAGSTAVP